MHTMENSAFWRACQDARDDAQIYGIHRTQEEVEKEAERYRRLEEKK